MQSTFYHTLPAYYQTLNGAMLSKGSQPALVYTFHVVSLFTKESNQNKNPFKLGTLSQQGGRVAGDQPYFPNCIWEILKNPKVLKNLLNMKIMLSVYAYFGGILATYNYFTYAPQV